MHGLLYSTLALLVPAASTGGPLQGDMAGLAPLLGTWEVNAEWASGQTLWSRAVYEVGIAGRTIEARVFVRDGDGEPYQRYSSVFTFDAAAQQFLAHTFKKDGSYSAQKLDFDGKRLSMEWTEDGTLIRDESDLSTPGVMAWTVSVKPEAATEFQTVMDARWHRMGPSLASIDSSKFDGSGAEVRSFVKEMTIDAPVAAVFAAWTEPLAFARSYDPSRPELKANIDLAVGGRYEWLWDGKMGSNGCQVLCFIPDRMLTFSWNAPPDQPESRTKHTWVVVEFDPTATGTRVTLTHLGFGTAPHWDETMAYFSKAWMHVLGQFKKHLEASTD